MVGVFSLAQHLVLAHGANPSANPSGNHSGGPATHLVWLAANGLAVSAVCALPAGKGHAVHAAPSPALDQVALCTDRAELLLADAWYTLTGAHEGQAGAVPAARASARVLAASHAGRASQLVMLPNEMFATAGEDGHVRLWQCTLGVTDTGTPVPQVSVAGCGRGGPRILGPAPGCFALRALGARIRSRPARVTGPVAQRKRALVPRWFACVACGMARWPQAANSSAPAFALTATLTATWRLGAPVTFLSGYLGGPLVVAGTAAGEVHVFNSSKASEVVPGGQCVHKWERGEGAPPVSSTRARQVRSCQGGSACTSGREGRGRHQSLQLEQGK